MHHRLIILKIDYVDYDPTPFRFYDSSIELEVFDDIFRNSWEYKGIEGKKNSKLFHGIVKSNDAN